MKRFVIGLVAAIALTASAAGSALAQPTPVPDSQACTHTTGLPGLTAILTHTAGCLDHP